MNQETEEWCKKWLQKANEDFEFLHAAIEHQENKTFFKSHIGFLCQQSIEKFLKAFLISVDFDFPRTHILEDLHKMCLKNNFKEIENVTFRNLSDFAVGFRYPDDYEEPTIDDIDFYINLVSEIKSLVESKIIFPAS